MFIARCMFPAIQIEVVHEYEVFWYLTFLHQQNATIAIFIGFDVLYRLQAKCFLSYFKYFVEISIVFTSSLLYIDMSFIGSH